jgi:hypothetical protein
MRAAGIPNDVIAAQVLASPEVFRPGPSDLIRLREAGLSDEVLRALVSRQAPQEPGWRVIRQEDGNLLLTDRDEEGRPLPSSHPERVNVVPAASFEPGPEPVAGYGRTQLPPDEILPEERYSRSSAIGWRWNSSWDEPDRGYPTAAGVTGGWGYGGGYYFLPAAYGPNGPSHFGRFSFFPPGPRYGTIAPFPYYP